MPCENRRKGYNRSMKEKYYSDCIKVLDEVGKVVIGKDDCIRSVMAAVLRDIYLLMMFRVSEKHRSQRHLRKQWVLKTKEHSLHLM